MAKNARTDYITSPEFRVSFAHIFQARVNPKNGKTSYGLVALFPKATTNMQALMNLVNQCAQMQWGDRANSFQWNNPIHDGDTQQFISGEKRGQLKSASNPELRGMWAVDMVSNAPVGVVDQNVQPIIDPRGFYSGCYAIARINCFAYQNEQYGISFGLGALQKIRDGEPLSGVSLNAEKEFAPVPAIPGQSAPQGYGATVYAQAPQQATPPAAPQQGYYPQPPAAPQQGYYPQPPAQPGYPAQPPAAPGVPAQGYYPQPPAAGVTALPPGQTPFNA